MRIYISYIVVLLLSLSCSDISIVNEEINNDIEKSIKSFSKKSYLYHEYTDSYIYHQNDPYSIENFQKAYEQLLTSKSKQRLTPSQINEISGNNLKLKATHYALRIYPKNETEQWKIELMEDIRVSYIPFDYVQIPKDSLAVDKNNVPHYSEVSKYKVIYDDYITSDDVSEKAEEIIMPILYVVWPCEKQLPDNIDYEIDYEVFIPLYDETRTKELVGLEPETLQLLENEAISIALGVSPQISSTTKSVIVRTLNGKICQQDHLLNSNVPLYNLKIQFKLGSNIWEVYSQLDGRFSITSNIPLESTCSFIFHHPRWKITTDNNATPIVITWGTVASNWSDQSEVYMSLEYSRPVYEIHRAVSFFYFGSHEIPKHYCDEGIRIKALNYENPDTSAFFSYARIGNPSITVFYNNRYNENKIIGTVLHELGHFVHYRQRGDYTGSAYEGFLSVNRFIMESYASYVGWYLGEEYYSTLGWNIVIDDESITWQGRQMWRKTDQVDEGAYYSPIFVDLVDNLNQKNRWGMAYNNDQISDVPHAIINEMAAECTNWSSVKLYLDMYCGIYYTVTQYTNFIEPYEFWFSV